MKDPNTPIELKYSHLLQSQPADPVLPSLLADLDSLYHAPETPPFLAGFGFERVKEQLGHQQEKEKQKRRQSRYRLLLGGLVVGLLGIVLVALLSSWLKELFLACFSFGLIFTLVSFALGGLGHLGSFHPGAAAGHLAHSSPVPTGAPAVSVPNSAGPHATNVSAPASLNSTSINHPARFVDPGSGLSWFNLSALVVFLTWFGGAGFILVTLELAGWLAVGLGLIAGVCGYLLILLVIGFLSASQTPVMQEQDYQLSGTVGQVSSTIREGGTGEVVYTRFGTRQSVAARTQDGQILPRGTQVVILNFSQGIAFVQDLNKLLSLSNQEQAAQQFNDELTAPEDHSEQP